MKYVLSVASEDRLGGIKVGEDFEIETDGTLNIRDMDTMRHQVQGLTESVSAGKDLIASAITEKGVETQGSDVFAVMAAHILNISSGVGYGIIDVGITVEDYELIQE